MKKLLLLFAFTLGINTVLPAQNELYIARDFRTAYENGTRAKDGKPGPNYWQNEADYDIKTKVDPVNSRLDGEARITYYNNSPDSLNQIVLRLYQNLFEKGQPRDYPVSASDIHGGVEIQQLRIDGERINQSNADVFKRSGTILTVALDKPLLPGETLPIKVRWRFHIPKKTHLRMGKGDSTSFFIAYWYPQISVYDDINGWDKTPYTGLAEFYNNYGDFEVEIDAPASFGVWATGSLQNQEEVYTKKFTDKIENAFATNSITHLITAEDYKKGRIPFKQISKTNTWKFKAQQVPDFAFTFGDHYLWDATGITLADDRRIQVSSVYREEAEDFTEVAAFARKAVDFFSHELPGVRYPYPQMTVVYGKTPKNTGGMEFPMIANNPTAPNRGRTADVTSHEIAHTYFPFYVGTNEHNYAWMDEGWAAMLPAEYMKEVEPSSNRLTRYARETGNQAGYSVMDLPIMTPSTTLIPENYFYLSYTKPAMAYNFLKEELGDTLFKKALQGYINRWKYKHPTPYDYFFSFNDLSGRNLNWFWDAWFFEQNHPDLSISDVQKIESGYEVHITNIGGLPLPIAAKLIYKDGNEEKVYKTMGVWKNNSSFIIEANEGLKTVMIGNKYVPDVLPEDNTHRVTQ